MRINGHTHPIIPGQISLGNISLAGQYDLPARIGDTMHLWGDDSTPEIFADSSEIFFGGRDLLYKGYISGNRTATRSQIEAINIQLLQPDGLQLLETPYGDYLVYIKKTSVRYYHSMAEIEVSMREPVVDLSGGELPAKKAGDFMCDGIPLESFGLYYAGDKSLYSIPEMQQQQFIRSGEEGYQVTARREQTFDLSGLITGEDLSEFTENIKNLWLLLGDEGIRTFVLKSGYNIRGAALGGFKVTDVRVAGRVTARFKCEITIGDE